MVLTLVAAAVGRHIAIVTDFIADVQRLREELARKLPFHSDE